MTTPMPDDVEMDEKSQRGFEPDELPAVAVALGVGLAAILMAVVAYTLDKAAVWVMGIGAALVVLGLWGGIRGAVGSGVLMLAIGGIVLTHEWGIGSALAANAVVIVLCILILMGADLSFSMRRGSQIAPETVQGFALVHGVALVVGIGASMLVVGAVEAISWPSWLIVVPIAGLTLAALYLVRRVRAYRMAVRAGDAPPVGVGQVAPAAENEWRRFKWQPTEDE